MRQTKAKQAYVWFSQTSFAAPFLRLHAAQVDDGSGAQASDKSERGLFVKAKPAAEESGCENCASPTECHFYGLHWSSVLSLM